MNIVVFVRKGSSLAGESKNPMFSKMSFSEKVKHFKCFVKIHTPFVFLKLGIV